MAEKHTLRGEIEQAIRFCNSWMGGSVVVTNGLGWYDAIPGAYLNDISYTGPREVVFRLIDLAEMAGGEVDTGNEAEVAAIAEMFEQNM